MSYPVCPLCGEDGYDPKPCDCCDEIGCTACVVEIDPDGDPQDQCPTCTANAESQAT